jgi:hypothetical protein
MRNEGKLIVLAMIVKVSRKSKKKLKPRLKENGPK